MEILTKIFLTFSLLNISTSLNVLANGAKVFDDGNSLDLSNVNHKNVLLLLGKLI